jgi:hypothetical protein
LKEGELDNSRLGALQFLNKLKTDVVRTWSTDRNSKCLVIGDDDQIVEEDIKNVKSFFKKPKIELKEWKDAYQWSLLNKKFVKFKLSNGDQVLCVAAGMNKEINSSICDEYFQSL